MKAPDIVPDIVLANIRRWCKDRPALRKFDQADGIIQRLEFDTIMGCYCFVVDGVYHGIELNGYIHT